MSSWLSKSRDRRASWSDDLPERHRAASADAPVAWIARSVLEAIGRSAEYGHPHFVEGELLGYWITPRVELAVVDWTGFGSLLFREPWVASTDPRGELAPMHDARCAPLGVWSTRPVARVQNEGRHEQRATSDSESMPMIHLLLERDYAWLARLTMLSRGQWPWDSLRRPREVELRVLSPRS